MQAEKDRIRKEAGQERWSTESTPEDFTIRGLTELLEILPKLPAEERKVRARLLWDALADLEASESSAFYGVYSWRFNGVTKTARFDADFVRTLNRVDWVTDTNGVLAPPKIVMFDSIGWKPNSFLLTKIVFKPPLIDQLAKEAGIDPAVLDLLRRDSRIVAELLSRLSTIDHESLVEPRAEKAPSTHEKCAGDVYGDAKDLYGDDMPDIPPGTSDPDGGDSAKGGVRRGGQGLMSIGSPRDSGKGNGGSGSHSDRHGKSDGTGVGGQGKRSPGHAGGRPFVSYIGTHADDQDADPDDLDQATRMRIEEQAITLIIELEPTLHRTPEGNPGFDLYETGSDGKQVRWVEVKSMTGCLKDRPVGLSHTQFSCARERGDAYWLYVVEYATDPEKIQVLRIHNPFSHAKTFTFDSGWRQIAQIEPLTLLTIQI